MIRTIFARLFKQSSILRFLVIPAVFLSVAGLIGGLALLTQRKPVLASVTPSIGEPGEVIVLKGKHFGNERGDGWVEIGGDRLSGSAFIDWTDTTIMAMLPPTVEDGLVYVHRHTGRSNPLIFANRSSIPIAAKTGSDLGGPEIESFSAATAEIGKTLTIRGKNFGIARNNASVLFTWQTDPSIPLSTGAAKTDQTHIACADHDFDYESWSDQEIRVRVPDGASSGAVFIQTDHGASNALPVQIVNQPGTKRYVNRRTYVLALQIDISSVSASEGNMLFVHVPMPLETASQRGVEITASSPEPYMNQRRGTILHQLENLKTGKNESITHSFLLTNYGVATRVDADRVQPYSDTRSPLYLMYTNPDRIVPSDNADIAFLAAEITGKEKNPWRKARLIYDWIAANITGETVPSPDRPVTEALTSRKGDAYDAAILFCAIARASGVPAIPVAGILVDSQQNSRIHWWAEFYLESFGWIPLDPGIGAGMVAAPEQAAPGWYFGNLDANHIAFSRGWTDQKPMTPKSRIVYKPRSFAFQPVWEESGGNIRSYASFWGTPRVTGVY